MEEHRSEFHDNHIADRELLLEGDGEVSAARAAVIRDHLSRCGPCRARKSELEQTLADFIHGYGGMLEDRIPPIKRSAARLQARLAAAAVPDSRWYHGWHLLLPQRRFAETALLVALIAAGGLFSWWALRPGSHRIEVLSAPNPAWTPGDVRPVAQAQVCSAPEASQPRPVAASIAKEVFAQYGISDPGPRTYELDYLIPPQLGGSDNARNLWPQPYSSGVWNARVKDALEDRLSSLVCEGQLDLSTAQRDLARDWIAAYRKYFRTDVPLVDHLAYVKDRPWE